MSRDTCICEMPRYSPITLGEHREQRVKRQSVLDFCEGGVFATEIDRRLRVRFAAFAGEFLDVARGAH